MKLFIAFLCLVVAGLQLPAQTISDSIMVDGRYRLFHFDEPQVRPNASLLFIMHGSGGSGKGIRPQAKKLAAIARQENLLIVYPDGYKHYWNECRRFASSEANKEDVDEQAFFNGMIRYFHQRYRIDTNRVFAAGFSGGGHMSYKLGLTMPGRFRAISAVVANMPDSASTDCITAGQALPVLIINGTDDNVNPYNGGEMFVNNASYGVVLSTEKSFQYWARLAGYKGNPVKKALPDTDPADKRIIESYTYKETGKPEVQLLKVVGGAHDYPNDIDVYTYVWGFFKRQL